MFDGKPFRTIQCYRVVDYPNFAHEIGVSEEISVDLCIGEPEFLGKGFGSSLLGQYLKVAFSAFPNESRCYICHEKENVVARGCTKSVGFRFIGAVIEERSQCELFVMER
jgi:aminoglycoside 6'-N-acetyltransferase